MDNDFISENNNDKLFNKINYLLTQLRLRDKKTWEPLKREYDSAEISELPHYYGKLMKAYKSLG